MDQILSCEAKNLLLEKQLLVLSLDALDPAGQEAVLLYFLVEHDSDLVDL